MDKKQYDAIIEVLNRTGCHDDLVLAMEGSTGFPLAQRIEELEAENKWLKNWKEEISQEVEVVLRMPVDCDHFQQRTRRNLHVLLGARRKAER